MRISWFRFAVVLIVFGSFWIGFVFTDSEKISQTIRLEPEHSDKLDLSLKNDGIGFFKIEIPNFSSDVLFVQVLDDKGNILKDKKIETKMSINYFDFRYTDSYSLKITNLSEDNVMVKADFGNTMALEMRIPGIILFLGILILIFSFYKKLRNYKIAQPEEKIS